MLNLTYHGNQQSMHPQARLQSRVPVSLHQLQQSDSLGVFAPWPLAHYQPCWATQANKISMTNENLGSFLNRIVLISHPIKKPFRCENPPQAMTIYPYHDQTDRILICRPMQCHFQP